MDVESPKLITNISRLINYPKSDIGFTEKHSADTETLRVTGLNTLQERKPLEEVIALAVISTIVLAINLRVICVSVDTSSGKPKPIAVFILNLAFICVALSFVFGVYMVERVNVVGTAGPITCSILSFSRNVIYVVYPLNIVAIIYVRIASFRESVERSTVNRSNFIIWTISLIACIPTLFWVRFENDPVTQLGKCKQIPLFGSNNCTIIFGILRFILLHVIVAVYMCFAVSKIRLKITFLKCCKPIPTRRIRNTIRRLRIVNAYSIFFILHWIPTGVIANGYATLGRILVDFSTFKLWINVIFIVSYSVMTLSPSIFLWLSEDIKNCCCFSLGDCIEISGEDNRNGCKSVTCNQNAQTV